MPIEFPSLAVESLYTRVVDDLEAVFESLYVSENVPLMVVPGEDAEVRLIVAAISDTAAAVRVVCWLARGINSFERGVMRYLLEETGRLPFGRFAIDDDGDIFFDIYVHGDGYSSEQLLRAVATVYDAATRVERHLELHWGGEKKPN